MAILSQNSARDAIMHRFSVKAVLGKPLCSDSLSKQCLGGHSKALGEHFESFESTLKAFLKFRERYESILRVLRALGEHFESNLRALRAVSEHFETSESPSRALRALGEHFESSESILRALATEWPPRHSLDRASLHMASRALL